MQSFFRLPWSTDTGGDKLVLDSVVHQKAKPKPVVEIPLLNKQKRKRTDSADSSPRPSHQPKKLKVVGGAVQPPLVPIIRGPDAHIAQPRNEAQVQVNGHKKSSDVDATKDELAKPAAVAPETIAPQATTMTANADSGESETVAPDVVGAPNATTSSTSTSQTSRHASTTDPVFEPVNMADPNNLDQLRSVIDAQLNLEILLKHNELRLIEQELAKCQIALEQLRRCELIPYPGLEDASLDVAGGIGPALDTPAGLTAPKLPAPWGVTDGPYARHYADWLIKDPLFDPTGAHPTPTEWNSSAYFSRAARRSGEAAFSPLAGMRSARSSVASKGQMLPHDPSRPYRDPLVIKRQQDGKWVKLYCTKCKPERSDFNNVQGFLNHCRISHKDGYESHEAAAIACGRPVEVNEAFMMDPPPPPRHRSSLASVDQTGTKTPTATTPGAGPFLPSASGSVHALNKVPAPKHDPATLRQSIIPRKFDPLAKGQLVSTPDDTTPTDSPFVPSPQTPHLNKLLQKRNMSGDLEQTVMTLKRKADLSVYDCSDSESHSEEPTAKKPKQPMPKKSGGITPAAARRPPTASQRPAQPMARPNAPARLPAPLSSFSSHANTVRQHGQAPRLHSAATAEREIAESPLDLEVADLSPGSTTMADSNPGLVSDREDDEDYVDVDEDTSVGERGQRCSFQSDAMVLIEDGSDGERGVARKRLGARAEGVVVEGVCSERMGEGSTRMG